MNKKGVLSTTIRTVGGIVAGIIALVIILLVFGGIFGAIFFKDLDSETKQTFEDMEDLLSNLEGENDMLFKFAKGRSLIVFNADKGSFGSGETGYYIRPTDCFDDACIILCEDGEIGKDQGICLESKYVIRLDVDGFKVEKSSGLIYPNIIGASQNEWKQVYFKKVDNVIEISLINN